jgi:hypothetical protein
MATAAAEKAKETKKAAKHGLPREKLYIRK